MAFDIEQWKAQLSANLPGWRVRMQASGVNSAYYFIAASAFLPIVQALQGGIIEPFGFATVASGLGTNLLANIVQNWRDEANAAATLQEAATQDTELQQKLDALLTRLEAFALAEQHLSSENCAWFADIIKQELARLGSGITYTAHLTGRGAIALGANATALGAGAKFVGGNYIENHFSAPDSRDLEKEKNQPARQKYLQKLRRHCQTLPLAALGGEEGAEEDISLDTVYIDLDTQLNVRLKDLDAMQKGQKVSFSVATLSQENQDLSETAEQRDEEMVPLPLINAVMLTPRVVLLGDPGAGKSTFARKLLGLQSAVLLGQSKPKQLNNLSDDLLPVLVILRELVLKLNIPGFEKLSGDAKKEKLLAAFRAHLTEDLQRMGAGDFLPAFFQAFEAGKILLVFDGLDEVPQDMRQRVRASVLALLAEYRLERLIITSRIRSYTGETIFPNLQTFTLRAFSKDQIRNFVMAWYQAQAEMGRFSEKDRAMRVDDLVKVSTSSLYEIASNPMMLTSMAIIHQKEISLPKERVRLYRLVVDVLLRRWQKHRFGEGQMSPSAGLVEFLKDERRLLAALERLAYEAHSAGKGKKEAADLLRKNALVILDQKEYLGDTGLAAEFLDYVDQRAGLLKGNGGELDKPTSYSFPHRTFQEYLAGCYLVRERNPARRYFQLAAEGDYWSLAAQLGAEELYYNRTGLHSMLDLAYQLLPADTPQTEQEARVVLWSGLIARTAGVDEIYADRGEGLENGPKYLKRLVPRLLGLFESALQPIERAEAGRVLAKLGDPRPEVLTCERMAFCYVPAGSFLYGDKKEKVNQSNEFWISKYPVTNAQFAQFVAAKGYENPVYWSEAIKEKYWTTAGFKGRYDNEPRTAPKNYGEPYTLHNHPVVGVSWYEALAFTRWLSEWLAIDRGQFVVNAVESVFRERLKAGKIKVVLPGEEQWEKATHGPDVSEYSWVGKFDPNKANTNETGIGSTSAVGVFPGGQSPYGLMDAIGNVWEWTASPYDQSSYVLRGGAFYYNQDFARCVFRNRLSPLNWNINVGFRVVCIFSRASL